VSPCAWRCAQPGASRAYAEVRPTEGRRSAASTVFFASLAARLDGPKADGKDTKINLVFTDLGESWVLYLENAVLHAARREMDGSAAATVKLTRPMLVRLVTGETGLRELVFSDELGVEGSRLELLSFLRLLDRPGKPFPIVTP
jgi:linear primary-alkylsulfatase